MLSKWYIKIRLKIGYFIDMSISCSNKSWHDAKGTSNDTKYPRVSVYKLWGSKKTNRCKSDRSFSFLLDDYRRCLIAKADIGLRTEMKDGQGRFRLLRSVSSWVLIQLKKRIQNMAVINLVNIQLQVNLVNISVDFLNFGEFGGYSPKYSAVQINTRQSIDDILFQPKKSNQHYWKCSC